MVSPGLIRLQNAHKQRNANAVASVESVASIGNQSRLTPRLRSAAIFVCVFCCVLLGATDVSAQTLPSGVSAIADVANVTTRSAVGKVSTFNDSARREFAVTYDEAGRVSSVLATRGRHFSDILSVGYAPDGTIIGVQLGNGETLFVQHRQDGTQLISNGRGGQVRRSARGAIEAVAEGRSGAASLSRMVERFDSLVHALGQ